MSVPFFFLSGIFFILYCIEKTRNRALFREVNDIKEWTRKAPYADGNRSLLIPSENREIKELAAEINRMLYRLYSQKADYERSRNAMMQVVTNISHDMRTPLTVLKGYSELLKHELKETDMTGSMADMAGKIEDKTNKLIASIDEFFTLSKIMSGDMKLELHKINITQTVHDVILDYYDILEKTRWEVEINIPAVPLYAYADTDALKRILKNLIDNAVKYGENGRYLSLKIRKEADNVKIDVKDRGKGIPKKDLEHIFCRNYTTAHKGGGSGLGLAISQKLALQMDADIQVTSVPEQGTVFTLLLKS